MHTPQRGATIITEPAVGPDGVVYSGSSDGTLTAFQGRTFEEYLADRNRARPGLEQTEEWLIIGDQHLPVEN